MEESMMVSIMMIKSKDMEYSHGQMEENMKVAGTMENNTEKVSTIHLKGKLKEENGKKVKE